MASQILAEERQIAQQIQDLVPCRLVGEPQTVVDRAARPKHEQVGRRDTCAKPLATLKPMRSPVNEPGPIETASRSRSRSPMPTAARTSSISGSSVLAWLPRMGCARSAASW